MPEQKPGDDRAPSGPAPPSEGTDVASPAEPPTTTQSPPPSPPPSAWQGRPVGDWGEPAQAPARGRAPLFIALGVIGLLALAVIAVVVIAATGDDDVVETFEAGDLSISLPQRFEGGDPQQVIEGLEESGAVENLPEGIQESLDVIRRFPELIVLFAIVEEGPTAGENLVVVRVPAPMDLDQAAPQIESQWATQGIEVVRDSTETYAGTEARRYETRLETGEVSVEQLHFLLKRGSALYVFTFTPGGEGELGEMESTFEESMESLTFES